MQLESKRDPQQLCAVGRSLVCSGVPVLFGKKRPCKDGTLQLALVAVAWHPLAGTSPAHALLVQLWLSSLARLMLSSLFPELVSD